MTGSSIFILFFFYVLSFTSSLFYFGKNYFLTGSSFIIRFEVPFITGVFGPRESDELGLVPSSLPVYIGFFSGTSINLPFKL